MKRLLFLVVLLVAGNAYSKAVPSPSVWFTLSEKLISSATLFVSPAKETKQATPVKHLKSNSKEAVKSQQALEALWNPKFKIRNEGMWIVTE